MPSDYAAITQDNIRRRGEEFDDIGRLVSEQLYSDRTHFVYELLQNAEDALARRGRIDLQHRHPRTVTFSLTRDTLSVSHFGQPFSTDDVRGIADVLRGTKSNDFDQIGRFGIGFKSVYAFTNAPQIYSGDEHFLIERYIRVYAAKPLRLADGETQFIFPLKHPSVRSEESFREISEKLRKLGPRVLLFLRQIDSIKWSIQGGASGQYRRESKPHGAAQRVTVFDESGDKRQAETWLRFDRAVKFAEGKEPAVVSVAYLLEYDDREKRERVKPIPDASLVVFFPTERATRLGFLMNGPYLTTPARDNIANHPFNAQLIRETGTLVVETLEYLKSMGLLTASTLQSLPIEPGDFGAAHLLRPIFEAVREALANRELLPAYGNQFVAARRAKLARSSDLRELISHAQLSQLFQSNDAFRWLSDEITFDRTPTLRTYLMQELKVQEVTPDVFAGLLDGPFLQKQPDTWISKLYAFLEGQPALWRPASGGLKAGLLRSKPIIRLQSGDHVAPFTPSGSAAAFLPSHSSTTLPTVRQAVLTDSQALEFLRRLPLTPPDLVAEVLNHVLPKYERLGADAISEQEHKRDVLAVIEALQTGSAQQTGRLLERLRNVPFFLAVNAKTGQRQRKRAIELYLPLPDLKIYFAGNPDAWFLGNEYEAVYNRLTEIGVNREIRATERQPNQHGYVIIASQYGHHQRGIGGFDSGFSVDGLEFALRNPTQDRSSFIWNQLLPPLRRKIAGFVETATKANYEDAHRQYLESVMGRLVRSTAWLPSPRGGWAPPSALSLSELPTSFQRDEHLAVTLKMKNATEKSYVEQALGFRVDPDDLDFLKKHWTEVQKLKYKLDQRAQGERPDRGAKPAEDSFDYEATLRETFQRPQSVEPTDDHVPPGEVRNPGIRRDHVRNDIQRGQEEEPTAELRFQQVERRVWEAKSNDTRVFLENQYGGKCQICTAVFHKRDGTPYFEGLYLVSQIQKRWVDRPGNVLCLCATCCAKFLYGSVEADDIIDQVDQFRARREGGASEPGLTISLCKIQVRIRFTEQHMLDLQELIRSGRSATRSARATAAASPAIVTNGAR